jgi:glycerol-1-phosphate dehydrogenase [NAD(P)+]
LNARPPKAIIADTAVLKQAPLDMIQAGVGDILGKYSCLNDWKLAALIRGEYFCQRVYDIVYETTRLVDRLTEDAVNRKEEALGTLMEALVTVGFAMSYVGNSRPASGSEHHLSHYFEITGILNDTPYFSHGIDVIYSAALTSKIRQRVLASSPKPYFHNREKWEKKIRSIYSTSSDEVIALQDRLGWYEKDEYAFLSKNWEKIKAVLKEAPTEEEMLELIRRIGLDISHFESFYGSKKIENGMFFAKDLKDRYTVLWLYYMYC